MNRLTSLSSTVFRHCMTAMVSKKEEPPANDAPPTRVFSEEAHGNIIVDDCLASIRRLESDPNSVVIFISGIVGSTDKESQSPQCSAAGVYFSPTSPANISEQLPLVYPKTVRVAESFALRLVLQHFLWCSRNDKNLWYSPNPVATETTDLKNNPESLKDALKHIESIENTEHTEKKSGNEGDSDFSDDISEAELVGLFNDLEVDVRLEETLELETDDDMRQALYEALHEAVQGAKHRREDTQFQETVERMRADIEEEIDLFGCRLGNNILKEIERLREMCEPQPQQAPVEKRFGISRVVIVTGCEDIVKTFCESDLKDLLKFPSRKALRKGKQIARRIIITEGQNRHVTGQIERKVDRNGKSYAQLSYLKMCLERQLNLMYKHQNYKAYMKEMARVKGVAKVSGRTIECERSLVELMEDICKAIKAVERLCHLDFWLVEENTLYDARDLANQAFSLHRRSV